MRVRQILMIAAGLTWLSLAYADCPPCGPTFCKDTPAYKNALAAKKTALSKKYPARLVVILDKVSHCENCVTTGPDGFSLLRQDTAGNITVDSWTAENERIGAADLQSGKLKACHVIYVRKACGCCSEAASEARPDWNKSLELNTEMSVPCSAK
jgi:hypothetical protein